MISIYSRDCNDVIAQVQDTDRWLGIFGYGGFDMSRTHVSDAYLHEQRIVSLARDCEFDNVSLSYMTVNADMGGTVFLNCALDYLASAPNASYVRCRFVGCSLRYASFHYRDLAEATFQDCDVRNVDFRNTVLTGASFIGCRSDSYTRFDGARWDGEGEFPFSGWIASEGTLYRACEHCGDPRIDRPNGCDACETCCDHEHCSDCDTHNPDPTSCCGECPCGCRCEEEEYGSSERECSGRVWQDGKARLVGVEWEHNTNLNLDAWLSKWGGGYHSDGSCGWEAVTPPIAGKHIEPCLKELGRVLGSSTIDNRCGIHVHVDARDFRWADMYRLLHVYSRVEPLLYLLGGQQRVENKFAVPCGVKLSEALRSLDRKGAILGVMMSQSPNEAKTAMRRIEKKHHGRYKGLNIMPWLAGRKLAAKDTTVEFRIHANEDSAMRVIHWVRVCEALVSWCATHTDREADALPGSALRALMAIVGPSEREWIMTRIAGWRRATRTYRTGPPGGRAKRRIIVSKGAWSCAV